MNEKIILDSASFKALAVDSRIALLKSLGKQRRTLSELSKEQKLGISTVKEHLDMLKKADLIKQIDEGYKWKYWELTDKGKAIIYPKETNILVILGSSIIVFLTGIHLLVQKLEIFSDKAFAETQSMQTVTEAAPLLKTTADSAAGTAETANIGQAMALPIAEILIVLTAAILIGFCLFQIWKRKAK